MTPPAMKNHTAGGNTFGIFDKEEKGGVGMLHFIWGKKDFRIYLGRSADGENGKLHGRGIFVPAATR